MPSFVRRRLRPGGGVGRRPIQSFLVSVGWWPAINDLVPVDGGCPAAGRE
jgi:hypothetical protein